MSGNSLNPQQDVPVVPSPPQETEIPQLPRLGELRQGAILAVSHHGLTVDIGLSQPGVVPPEDLEKLSPTGRESLEVGQEILVYVTSVQEGHAVQLSRYLAEKEEDWLAAEDLQQHDAFWEGEVAGYNKGGLVVPFGHIRGFVPASQVSGITRNLSGEEKLAQLGQFVGRQLAFKVVDVDRRQRRLILSERLGQVAQRSRKQETVLTELHKGDSVCGRVRALTEYGAFVDLGGMVGLIHRTELAWFRVEHPVEIVQEGQQVEAQVLRVNRERGRVSLSLKRTYPDPWSTVMERYTLDQLVEGRVIRHTGAGLFLFLEDGILGFIPQSDAGQSAGAEGTPAIGQRALARLVRIDGARRRLGLSLRRVQQDELEEWRSRTAPPPGPAPLEAPEPALEEEPAVEPAAPLAAPEPAREEEPAVEPAAPLAAPEPAVEEEPAVELAAPLAAPEPAREEEPAVELAAPPEAPEPALEEEPAVEFAAPLAAPEPAVEEEPAVEPAAPPEAPEPALEEEPAVEPAAPLEAPGPAVEEEPAPEPEAPAM